MRKVLASHTNPGHVLAAFSDSWVKTINGDENGTDIAIGQSAVFAFKDERPAKYLKVTILSAYAHPWSNVYQIQLFGVLQ